MTSPPNQISASHAPFSPRRSCQSSTRVTSSSASPRNATAVGDDAVPLARQPQQQHDREDRQHRALVARDRAHRAQPLGRQRLRRRGVAQRRRAQPVDDVAGTTTSATTPGTDAANAHVVHDTCNAGALPRQLGDQRIRRGRGEEHRRDDEIALIERLHQERADQRCGRARLRAERPRDAQRDGKQDAAGARGVRRRHRRHRRDRPARWSSRAAAGCRRSAG